MRAFIQLCQKVMVVGLALVAGADSARAHGAKSRVELEIEETGAVKAGEVVLTLQLVDLKKKEVLGEEKLAVVHEKKLHVFIFDPALQEYRHEHPEYNGSAWVLKTQLSVNGNYWVWAQGEILADQEEFSTSARLSVEGGSPANTLPPVLKDVRSGNDGNSVVSVSNSQLVAGKMAMLDLSFSRRDGTAPEVTPYLGALAHVVGVLEDGDTLIHVHPMSHGGQMMIHAVFAEAGKYRLWVQFKDGGKLRTVPLSVVVARK